MKQLHNPFSDACALLRAVPQLATIFAQAPTVPGEYLDGLSLRCVCGATTALTVGSIVECDGYCGRHFLSAGGRVRAAMLGSTEHVDLEAERRAA